MSDAVNHIVSDIATASSGKTIAAPLISFLVAADENNVIGYHNTLPWHLPADLKYFKNLTWGMPIVMGRKTFESIGKPLPGRRNIVITRNDAWTQSGIEVVHSIEAAMAIAMEAAVKEIFVIGGAEIFTSLFQKSGRIYLTRIHHPFEGDVYFPSINGEEWELIKNISYQKDDKNRYDYSFQIWNRK